MIETWGTYLSPPNAFNGGLLRSSKRNETPREEEGRECAQSTNKVNERKREC
jgi:hypothetical protein